VAINSSKADVVVQKALFQLFASSCHGQFAVLYALGADQAVSDLFNFVTLAFYDQYFQAVVSVEMDVEC